MNPPDAIIIGGGIQGVSMALAAAQRGLSTVIVERKSLAAGATGGSYGIVHGGLRYLQTLDIPRWRRSRRAQAWYLQRFPGYVRPLRCVMPLYKGRLRSPQLFRGAIALEKSLASIFDAQVPLPPPQLLSAGEVLAVFDVPPAGLVGAACWHDAEVTDMPGLLQSILNQAGVDASSILMPFEARELLMDQGQTIGLRVVDTRNGETRDIMSRVVINCTGAWAESWQKIAECPPAKTLAFNLLLEGRMPGDSALAISAIPGKGRSYFLRPHPGGIFVGTYYRPAPEATEPVVNEPDIQAFLGVLDAAMPGLNLRQAQVKEVMAGLLPDKDGTGKHLSSHDRILAHRPHGFYSLLGGKFTTAPLLSEDAADLIWDEQTISNDISDATLAKHHG
jgi:glycerol-3-phosphate dehydrogenase